MTMRVLRLTDGGLEEDYGILCKALFPKDEDGATFGFVWAEVPPGGASNPDAHPEHEAFVIAAGSGTITVDGTATHVSRGDAVFIPAGTEHVIRNTEQTPLSFVAIWWDESVDREPLDG
ncbi:MAG: cupin domain-containing protein [Solirubrobacteraceae bacterium]|nr:MAG: cupin domain-containing protein [Chloroflexota bacterium]